MQQVYLDDNTKFGPQGPYEATNQNQYGTMFYLPKKLDLITTQYVGDYRVFHSGNGKKFLCIDASSQMGVNILKLQAALTAEKQFAFKPSKKILYIRMSDSQADALPKLQNLLISVNVYGVFLQSVSKLAFLQFELSDFKTSQRIIFDAMNTDDNAVFP